MASTIDTSLQTKVDELAKDSSKSTTKTTNNEMGKDQFLQLLVTQMQYQDPLNPQTDSTFVAQLAQFTSLEQMQNLNQTSVNNQALNLVGREVVVNAGTDSAKNLIQGTVDYVTMQNNEAYLSVNGTLYSIDKLQQVYDTTYVIQQYLPSVTAQDAKFDKSKPTDIQVKLNLGSNGYDAQSVAVVLNGKAIDSDKLTYKDGILTINSDALKDLDVGKYNFAFVFDDPYTTTVTDKVTVQVNDSSKEDSTKTA